MDTEKIATEEESRSELGTMPITKLLTKLSVPLILSFFVQTLYGFIDSLYVARLSDTALTAISLNLPIQYILSGLGTGLAVGASALLSKKLGENDRKGVNKIAGNAFLLIWVISILFPVLGKFLLASFFRIQTDIPEILDMCLDYSRVMCYFSFAQFHQVLFERFLSSTGKTKYTMYSMAGGAVINIILDPVFIFGWFGLPAMGISGAAYATVLAQFVAAVIGLVLNLRKNREIQFSVKAFRPDWAVLREILGMSLPIALSSSLPSVLPFGLNNILIKMSPLAPAIYVAYIRTQTTLMTINTGTSQAAITLVAYNYGAKKFSRIMETLKKCLKLHLVISVIVFLLIQTLPRLLLGLFNASPEMMEIGIPAVRILCFTFPLIGCNIQFISFLQGFGKSTDALLMSIAQIVLTLGGTFLASLTGNLLLVWAAYPAAEAVRTLFGGCRLRKIYRESIDVVS